MKWIATLAIRAPRRTLAVAVAIGVIAAIVGSGTPDRLSNSENDFLSHNTQSYRTTQLLDSALGPLAYPNIAVILPANQSNVGSIVLTKTQKVASVLPQPFYSRNKRVLAILGYFHSGIRPEPAAARLARELEPLPGVLVGGSALVGAQFSEQVKRDLVLAGAIAFPLLLILGFLIFRSVVAALLPVLVAALALAIALLCLWPITALYPLSILSLNVITGVTVGLSIDYSLLLVSRYREELARGQATRAAARMTVFTAGRTVALSATTVAVAFASVLVFPLDILRSIAIGGALVAGIAGLISLVVLPAVFALLGANVNALAPRRLQRSAERSARPEQQGFWYRLARFVMRHPIMIALAAAAVLLGLGIPSLGMRLTGLDAAALPLNASTHRFEERAKSEFDYSFFDEVLVAAHGNRSSINALVSQHIAKLGDVRAGEVRNVRGDLWELNIKTVHPPFTNASKQFVRLLRAIPERFGIAGVTGVTADYLDTAASLRARLPLAFALLAASTMTILFFATGSVILPFKALIMNLLSLSAALGLLVLIFQDGRLEAAFRYRSIGALALTQPILLVAGTFGISTDYGIFLLTRIREGWDSGLSNRDAIALGVERTGRIVTAAALLFCVAVGSLISAKIIFVKEIGFGIAAAVAIDATIVRALLVPSLMTLLGRWNWWRPELLRALAPDRRRGYGGTAG